MWKAILSGPLALLSLALSAADNPFPAKKMSGEKCVSWTKTIDLELVKEIKTKTGNEHSTKLNVNVVTANADIIVAGVKKSFLIAASLWKPNFRLFFFLFHLGNKRVVKWG